MTETTTFDPSQYLTQVGSSSYLEVKWRLVWLRRNHPDATIETELVSQNDRLAIFRAKVEIPGGGSATGFGSEGPDDFRDYIEKAETKAIGRALAALGFGTQFCPDFEFGATTGHVVDAPIDFASTRGRRMISDTERTTPKAVTLSATANQIKYIENLAKDIKLSVDDVSTELEQLYGSDLQNLSRRDASAFIDQLQERKSAMDLAS